jgi:hypothetical protein
MAEEQLTKTPERNYRWTVVALGAVFAAGTAYALFFPFCTAGRVSAWIQHQIPFGRSLALPEASWLVRGCQAGRTEGSLWSAEGVLRGNPEMRARLTMYPNVSAPDTQAMDMVATSLSATGADAGEVYTRSEAEARADSLTMEIKVAEGKVAAATFIHPDHSVYIYPISEPRLSDVRWSSFQGASLIASLKHVLDRRRLLVYVSCPESPSKEAAISGIKQAISRCSPVWESVFENTRSTTLPGTDDCSHVFDHVALTPAWQPGSQRPTK